MELKLPQNSQVLASYTVMSKHLANKVLQPVDQGDTFQPLDQKVLAAVDFAQAFLAVDIVGLFRAVAEFGRVADCQGDPRALLFRKVFRSVRMRCALLGWYSGNRACFLLGGCPESPKLPQKHQVSTLPIT